MSINNVFINIILIFILSQMIPTRAQNMSVDNKHAGELKNCQDLPSFDQKNIQNFLQSLSDEDSSQIQTMQKNFSMERNEEVFLYRANPVEIIDYKIPELSSFYGRQFDQYEEGYLQCQNIAYKLCCYQPIFKSSQTQQVVVKRKKRALRKNPNSGRYKGKCYDFSESKKIWEVIEQIGNGIANETTDLLDTCFPIKKTVTKDHFYKTEEKDKEWDKPNFKLSITVIDQDEGHLLADQIVKSLGSNITNDLSTNSEGLIEVIIDDKNISQLSKTSQFIIQDDLIYHESKIIPSQNLIEELVKNGSYNLIIEREKKPFQNLTIVMPCYDAIIKQNFSIFYTLGQNPQEFPISIEKDSEAAILTLESRFKQIKIILKDNRSNNKKILYDNTIPKVMDQKLLGISCLHIDKEIVDSQNMILKKGKNFQFNINKTFVSSESELNSISNKTSDAGDLDFLFFNIDQSEKFILSENNYEDFFANKPYEIEMGRGEKKDITFKNMIKCDQLSTTKNTFKTTEIKIIPITPDPSAPNFSIKSLPAKWLRPDGSFYQEVPSVKLIHEKHYEYSAKTNKISIYNGNSRNISPFFVISKCFELEHNGEIKFNKISASSDNEGFLYLNKKSLGKIANYTDPISQFKSLKVNRGLNCLNFFWYNRFKKLEDMGALLDNKDMKLPLILYKGNIGDKILTSISIYKDNISWISFDIELEATLERINSEKMSAKEILLNKKKCLDRIKEKYFAAD